MSILVGPGTGAQAPVLVLGPRGEPEAPPSIVAELRKRVGPDYTLKFSSGLAGSGWDVARIWPADDPRRQWIRDGKYTEEGAWDRIGSIPFGCSLDQAPAHLERMFACYPALDANVIQGIRARLTKWNEQSVPTEQVNAVVADVMEDVARDQRAPKGQLVTSGKTGRSRKAP